MPCRAYLSQLREAEPEIRALGASVLAVATGARWQAERLMATDVPFPCLVDPDKNLYRALGIRRIPLRQWVRPATWGKYLRSSRHARQGALTGDPLQAPGVAIFDTNGTLRYLHRGQTLADYPTIDEVLATLRRLATSG